MTKCSLLRFSDNIKMEGTSEIVENRAAIQSDLGRQEEWTNRNPIKFRRSKCQVLYLGRKITGNNTGWVESG